MDRLVQRIGFVSHKTGVWFYVACVLLLLGSWATPAAAQTTVGFQVSSVNATSSPLTVNVVLSAASTNSVTVQYATQDGTATSPSNYAATSGTLIFSPGTTSQSFTVTIDTVSGAGKNFSIQLSNPVNASMGMSLMSVSIGGGGGGGGGGPPPSSPGSVTPTAGAATPNPVASGQLATSPLSATFTAPSSGTGSPTYSGPTWTWSASGAVGVTIDQPSNLSPAATLKATITIPGTYTVTVTATAKWTGSDGTTVSASGSTSVTLAVVGVQKVQYFQPAAGGGGSYVDVFGTVYVLVGKSVSFKAIPTPGGSTLPAGNPVWGGSSGASGTGETISVTFPTLSATSADFQTVTATCGNTAMTANVIVFDLLPTMTPQDNFAGRDLDYYGVCELIDLTFSTVPSGINAYTLGGLKWQIDSGAGVLTDNGNGTGVYECAVVADTVTLALEITGGAMLAQKKLPPPKGITPPDAHDMAQRPNSGLWHRNGRQSCFVKLDFWAKGPKDVSFNLIECREGKSDKGVGKGVFIGLSGKIHEPSANWVLMGDLAPIPPPADDPEKKTGKGYKWLGCYDQAGMERASDVFGDGTFEWNIYMDYRKFLGQGVANVDPGQWYANNLLQCEAKEVMGIMMVWRVPVGPFMRKAADKDHQNYDPEP